MIKGQLFIDLEKYIDLEKFDSLQPSICRGMAIAQHLGVYGLQMYHAGTVNPYALGLDINPLSEVYNHWNSLPDNDPLKVAGKDLNYNQLTTYLKFSSGAYDHYTLYKVLDNDYSTNGVGIVGSHFPELVDWVHSLKDLGIFKSLYSVTIFALDAGGIPWEHRDPENPTTETFDPNVEIKYTEITEFIHVKTDCDRPFYIIDPVSKKRVSINTRVAWWDERDWHGGEPISRPTYTIRVNGRFTDEFKKQIDVEGYDVEL
jgi:hypothetical protein